MPELTITVSGQNTSQGTFQQVDREVNATKRAFQQLERAAKIDGKVNLDDADIDQARRELEDLDDTVITADVEVETDGAESAVSNFLSAGGPVAGMFAAAGAAFGDDFISGFTTGFNSRRNRAQLAIRTGLEDTDLAAVGAAAGDAYTAGFGESMAELTDVAAQLEQNLGAVDASLDLSSATRQVSVLTNVIGADLNETLLLTQRLLANNLVGTSEQAFDLMTAAAQEFGVNSEELLAVLNEFAPVFSKLEIDGTQAIGTMGRLVQEGLLPNVDRAAELFEEFNIGLSETDSLRGVIQRLGLDFETMQRMLANGQGGRALQEIAQALLEIEVPAERNAAALEIFGASIESAADPQRVLEILAVGEALENVAGSADRATAAVEENVSAWERAGRDVEHYGGVFGRITDFVSQQQQKLADKAPDGFLFGSGPELEESAEKLEDVGRSAEEATAHFLHLNDATAETRDQFVHVEDPINVVADRFAEMQAKAEELTGALNSLSDWASDSGEGSLRNVHAAADELTEAFDENTLAAFDLRQGWDLTSEAGRDGSRAVADLRRDVAQLTENFLEHKVGPDAFRAAMADLEAQLRQTAAEAGFSEDAIDALVESVIGVPTDTQLRVHADTAAASNNIANLNAQLDGINGKTANTFVNNSIVTHYREIRETVRPRSGPRAHGGVVGAAASGGIRGGLTLVGEAGPELVELAPGSNVITNPDTERMLGEAGLGSVTNRSSGGASGMNVTVNVQGSVISERELVSVVRDELVRGGLLDAFASSTAVAL